MSDISQLASRVGGGGWGGSGALSSPLPGSVRGAGRGAAFPPFGRRSFEISSDPDSHQKPTDPEPK